MRTSSLISLLYLSLRLSFGKGDEELIPLGTIFSKWEDYKDVYKVMQFALSQQHNSSGKSVKFKLFADNINTVDAYKLTRIICHQFERGIFALMGTVDPESFDTLHSFANAFEMPFVTPWFPESDYPSPKDSGPDFSIQIRPEYHQGLIDLISYYDWSKVIYIYSNFDGLLRLQRIMANIPKGPEGLSSFTIEVVKRIFSSGDAIEFLLEGERRNKHSSKYIVLDVPTNLAQEIIYKHVQNVHLGRRNYHYLMCGLVFDEGWKSGSPEFGAINMTGFTILHSESSSTVEFMRKWSHGGHLRELSAAGALAYDTVSVLSSGFNSLLIQYPRIFERENKFKGLSCEMKGESKGSIWEHGSLIAKALKGVHLNGLTGPIRFNSRGQRTNFTLSIVEMTTRGQLVKIGSWGDESGLSLIRNPLLHFTHGKKNFESYIRNKTYIMTSILEEPYLMLKKAQGSKPLTGNDRFEGYCKDLADLIAYALDVNFLIVPVKDGKYGSPDAHSPSGWNGMMGELIRNEAEIAIAPLSINSQREQMADFTKPFMTLGISIMIKKPAKTRPGLFSFLNPLSMEIWCCILFALLSVSIVLFLVSRFSGSEWKIQEVEGGTNVKNHFSLSNSLWFSIGALLQQGSETSPSSVSGRILGGSWWFFSLILISSYTANLAAFLTVERMVTPINSVSDLASQSEIEYGALDGGSTASFFRNSKISTYARMWEFMSTHPHVMTNSTAEGIRRVRESRGKYAFLIESTSNEYTNERSPCDTMKVGKNLDAKGYGIATSKSSGLKDKVNLIVLNLKENGELAKLTNKWWYERTECLGQNENTSSTSGRQNELSLSNVAGIFFILVAGTLIAMVFALIEFCVKSRSEASRAKTSLSDAMKNKARLALSGGRDMDSIRFYGDSSAL